MISKEVSTKEALVSEDDFQRYIKSLGRPGYDHNPDSVRGKFEISEYI